MQRGSSNWLSWFFLSGCGISLGVMAWMASIPSLSADIVWLQYSLERLVMLGLAALCAVLFASGAVLSRVPQYTTIFTRFLESTWLYLAGWIGLLSSTLAWAGTLLHAWGRWNALSERLLPMLTLVMLIFLNLVVFQRLISRGKIRIPNIIRAAGPLMDPALAEHHESLRKRLPWYGLLVILPVLINLVLISALGLRLANFHPGESDEIVYQQEIATFRTVGFQGGYFSLDELVARSSFSHYGAHGPIFAATYGLLARVGGWARNSGPYYNASVVCLALVGLLALTKPSRKQTFLLMGLLGTYWALVYYIPTIMQESLNHALAILLAGFLIRLSRPEVPSRVIKALAVATLVFASALRLTWVLAAFPIFYLLIQKRMAVRILLSGLLSIGFVAIMAGFYLWWTSAYPIGFLFELMHVDSLGSMLNAVRQHFIQNVGLYFRKREIIGLEIFFHYQFLFILVVYLVARRKKNGAACGSLFLLISSLLLILFLYDVYDLRDFRNLATFLLVAVICLAFVNLHGTFRWFLGVYLAGCLVSAPIFFNLYSSNVKAHFSNHEITVEPLFANVIQSLQFEPDPNPWCNSLMTFPPFGNEIRLIPPGIGINLRLTDLPQLEIHSRYVFLSKEMFDRHLSSSQCDPLVSSEQRVFCVRTDIECLSTR